MFIWTFNYSKSVCLFRGQGTLGQQDLFDYQVLSGRGQLIPIKHGCQTQLQEGWMSSTGIGCRMDLEYEATPSACRAVHGARSLRVGQAAAVLIATCCRAAAVSSHLNTRFLTQGQPSKPDDLAVCAGSGPQGCKFVHGTSSSGINCLSFGSVAINAATTSCINTFPVL